jgi:hypothetical protein
MYDLSIITDTLSQIVTNALASSPLFGGGPANFSVGVSGQHPQTPTSMNDCDVNLYLFHVTENKFLKNSFWTQAELTGQPAGPVRQGVAFEPLCLDLFYLLSAQSQSSYVHEQQAMSIAMRALHEFGTVKLNTPTPTGQATSEVSIGLESPTWDELSRLWQALAVPLRMTAQYRVGVALLMPETGLTDQPHPTTWSLGAGPATPPDGGMPTLYGTTRRVSYVAPAGQLIFDQLPASAAPAPTGVKGQEFMLRGSGLADTDVVYLVTYAPDGTQTEIDITATWKQPLVPAYQVLPAGGVPFVLRPPATPPGATPPPGRYGLRVGRPSAPGWRSPTVPFMIAPWVDPVGGPLLNPSGSGLFTFTTANVPASDAEVRLGTAQLSRITSGSPGPGQWRLSGTTLRFKAPGALPTGQYAVRVRAADVEADPAQWAVVA